MKRDVSIFRQYYSGEPIQDRFVKDPSGAIDVIIPVIHTNELWEANLVSLYREIPINRLLIGNGGCKDDSLNVVQKFPRVTILDQQSFVSLGYSIRKLIEAVETDWFVYVHSDVFLPSGWFDTMRSNQGKYDWFGCPMHHTIMVEYAAVPLGGRPYMGSQMGRKSVFINGLSKIDDDFVYRQEDFVFVRVMEEGGGREGRVEDTFHYHQTMHKPGPFAREVLDVSMKVKAQRGEEIRSNMTQARGIVKYLRPSTFLINDLYSSLCRLQELGELDWREFRQWTKRTNPEWMPYVIWWPLRVRVGAVWRSFRAFLTTIAELRHIR